MAAGAIAPTPLAIQALGGFRVLRHGEPVPAEEWKSKKARDLLKILAARRGNPVTARTADRGAVARGGSDSYRQPSLGGSQHAPIGS